MRAIRIAWVLAIFLSTLHSAHAKTAFAYVANNLGDTVSVVNTNTHLVVTTIPVGTFPYGVAVDQAGKFAYVTNSASNDVSVISTATNTVVATIGGQAGPMEIVLTPNGKTAYVSNSNSGSVAVINTSTRQVTATIPVPNPIGLAVTPSGGFLYVVSSSASRVLVISTLTRAVVASIPVGTIPVSVVISPDGSTAYAINFNSNTVSVIRTGDNRVTKTIGVSRGPFGAAVSPDGHWLYVANYDAGGGTLVTVINTSTQAVAGTVSAGTGPQFVAFSQDSAFAFVTNVTSNNVSVIKTASRTNVGTISVGKRPIGVGVIGVLTVSTVAGGYVGDNGAATNAALGPYSTVEDAAGNLFISDFFGNRIRKVSPTGTITTYAGNGICGYNGDNIVATTAMLCAPNGLALDSSGNLVLADGSNARIRKIDHVSGKITTIAGNGVFGYSGDGGSALKAAIGQPFKITYDSTGDLYFAQVGNCVVRKINTVGTIKTVAGTGTCGFNGDGIVATTARLNLPRGVALDANGNLYIADTLNHRVRKVTPGGIISTFAGNGNPGFSGDGLLATNAKIGNPGALVVHNGVLYIANAGKARVRLVNLTTNIINTYAGSFPGYDGDNNRLLSTRFTEPQFTVFDPAGNPVFDDALNGRVRKATSGIVHTVAGGFLGDGASATSAALVFPEALAVDKSGSLYIADWAGNRIRKVSAGKITTIAGTNVNGYSGDGGPATAALLNGPLGVAADSNGNVFIADTGNGSIRKVNTAGTISTFASNLNFSGLAQMSTDTINNLYVADFGACVVWKITPTAVVSVLAGVFNTCGFNGDNISATAAQLNGPGSVAVDSGGNVLIADSGNSRVRRVNTSGVISTIAGNGKCNYTGDGGLATSGELCPASVAVNKSGVIYVADFNFERIRKISGGIITTFAGAGFGFNGDGLWPLYTALDDPVAVAVDSLGTVYELDDWDHRVRKIQ